MRTLTRMAAIGGVGLLALTACGDNETEENTENTEEQGAADEVEGFEASELNDLAADEDMFSTTYDVECQDDLEPSLGHYVLCDIEGEAGEKVLFSMAPDGEPAMRHVGEEYSEPPDSGDGDAEEPEADGEGEELPDFYNEDDDDDSNSGW